jgi:hypothetical protein
VHLPQRAAAMVTISTSMLDGHAAAAQPVLQHVVVAGISMDDAEAQLCAFPRAQTDQFAPRPVAPSFERSRASSPGVQIASASDLGRNVTALPFRPSTNGTDIGTCRPVEPQGCGDGQRGDQMSRIAVPP